jgi:hypothetical protein
MGGFKRKKIAEARGLKCNAGRSGDFKMTCNPLAGEAIERSKK